MTEDEAYKVHIQYTFNAFCYPDVKSAQRGSEDPCGEIEYFQASDFFCK